MNQPPAPPPGAAAPAAGARAAEAASLAARAIERLQAGENAEAEQLARGALELDPSTPPAQATLGLALQFAGRFGEAEGVFAELAAAEPGEVAHWVNLGTARRCDGRPDEALLAYTRAAQLGESSADFLYNVGLAQIERRDYEAARGVLARARAAAPRDAEIRLACARAAYESLQSEEAVAALADWAQLENLSAGTVAEIGFLLMNLGEGTLAGEALERALADPDCPAAAALTIVKMLERTNRVEEARALLERVKQDPGAKSEQRDIKLAEAQLAQRAGQHERAAVLFRERLGERGAFDERHYQLFPLAKSLDALGRYEDAFAALVEAHASQAEYIGKTAPLIALRGAPTLAITEHGCDATDVAQWRDPEAPPLADSPVFIVAFPRSGTTLLELTLDAHPDLVSMDEQPFLQNALEDLLALGAQYPERLAPLDARQLQLVRSKYWDRTLAKARLGASQRLVDKNPLNMLRLPVIRRLFPHAPIVLAIRHPCDVLLSCWMQHFRAPDFALMCRDLGTLANGFRRAFDFWYAQSALLAPRALEVRYERYVADFEPEVRRLAAFLELPWNDAMLAPGARAQQKGFISTPSYSQVVQPVNSRSVDRWRRYERHFAPVLPLLEPLLQRWGYAGLGSPNSR
ncbi:MAG: sulfotransferase [Steroidobacteraceae bacterium]